MAFKQVASLDADVSYALGGINKKTGKPNPTKVEGYYLGTRQVESKMSKTGFANIHFIQTSKGNVGIWGKTDLDRKIKQVTLGYMVRITQSGMQTIPGKKPMYKYVVESDDENTIEVAAPEASSLEASNEDVNSDFDGQGAAGYEEESDTQGYGDEAFDDTDPGEEEQLADEVPPARATRPARPAATPDAARQAKVKELLAKGRGGKTA